MTVQPGTPPSSSLPAWACSERPLIHIGYHKTATKWFQQQCYPVVRHGCFIDRDLVRETLIAPRAYEFSAERARASLRAAAAERRLFICEENLTGYLHNGGLGDLLTRELANRIHGCFPEATIVVFLRAQPSLFEACYAQYVRAGGTYDIEHYLRAQERGWGALRYWYKAPLFSWQHFDYAPVLDQYCKLFGRANVRIYLYEEFAADVRVFLQRFASELDLAFDEPPSYEIVNASLAAAELVILRKLNLFTARSVLHKRYFTRAKWWYRRREPLLRWLRLPVAPSCRKAVTLDPALRARIHEYFRASNTAIAARYNLPLARFGYPLEETRS